MLRSGIATRDDEGKWLDDISWVRKAPTKEVEFDLERACETFIEEKKSFTEASTLGIKDKPDQEMDLYILMTFLKTPYNTQHMQASFNLLRPTHILISSFCLFSCTTIRLTQ